MLFLVVVYCVHFLLLCCTFQKNPSVILVTQCSKRVEAAVAALTLFLAGVVCGGDGELRKVTTWVKVSVLV